MSLVFLYKTVNSHMKQIEVFYAKMTEKPAFSKFTRLVETPLL